MKCEEFGSYLDNYEMLTDAQKTELYSHAEICEKCQQELDFFLSMISAAKTLPQIEPPADFMEKLNKRLDAEDKKVFAPSKIVYHVRRNWKQYTAVAACFALVAVITANRGILLDRIEGTEDGVITEETVKTPDDNAAPDGTEQKNPELTPQNEQSQETAPETQTSEQVNAPSEAQPQQSSGGVRQTAQVSRISASNTAAPARRESRQTVVEETASETQTASVNTSSSGYSIAETDTQAETAQTAENAETTETASVNDVRADYSLASTAKNDNIALGRYYRIDKDGNPIDEDNEPKAIGSLNISSSDADKAMEVISQYPHGVNGGYYTTDAANFSLMLSMMSSEGISYTNYTPVSSGDVKFMIVFN